MKKIPIFGLLIFVMATIFFATPALAEPVAKFTITPDSGVAPLTVELDGSQSEGDITSYVWEYDEDNTIGEGETITYTFNESGTYDISLTAMENVSSYDRVTKQLTVDARNLDVDVSQNSISMQEGGNSKTVNVEFTNKGNIPAIITLGDLDTLTDGTNTLSNVSLEWSTDTLELPVNSSEIAIVTIDAIPAGSVTGTYTSDYQITIEDGGNIDDSLKADPKQQDEQISLDVEKMPQGISIAFVSTQVNFGSSTQERSTEDDEVTVTKTIQLKNTGAETVSGISLTSDLAEDYNVDYSLNNFNLAPGNTASIEVTITVPIDQDSGEKNIGTITATGTSSGTEVKDELEVDLTTESNLEITDIEYDISGGENGDLDVDGSSDRMDDEIAPGDEVEFTITVENTFDDDIRIKNIDVRIRDEDNELDFDDDKKELDDLRDSGDEDSVTFTMTLDDDADADGDIYSFRIEVSGEDENGAEHTDTFDVDVEANKPNNEVTITDLRMIPTTVTCQNTATLEVTVENTGSNDLSSAAIEVLSDYFDYRHRDTNINIDEDESYTSRFTIDVSDLEPGTYSMDVVAYYKLSNNADTDTKFVDLVVGNCQTNNNDNDNGNNNDNNNNQQPPDLGDFPTGNVIYGQEEESEGPNWLTLGLLALAIVLVVILIIVVLLKAAPAQKN